MRRWRTDAPALRLVAAFLIGAIVLAPKAYSETRPTTESRSSAGGLTRLSDYFRNEVASRRIPGAVVLIQQPGKPVYFENFGLRDAVLRLSKAGPRRLALAPRRF